MDKPDQEEAVMNKQLLIQSINGLPYDSTGQQDCSPKLLTEPNHLYQTIPRKPRPKTRNYSSRRLKQSPEIYVRPSSRQLTSNHDLLQSDRIKLRSSSRKKRFESKLERLITDNSVDNVIQTYQGELDYLRKRLQTCETDKVVLAKNIKLVKNQELESALEEAHKNMDQLRGKLQKANQIITYYEEIGKKKTIMKKLREQNIALEGQLHANKIAFEKMEKQVNEAQKDKTILKGKIDTLKKQIEHAHFQQNIQNRTRRSTSIDAQHRQFANMKKKNTQLELAIEKLKQERYALEKEVGTLKNQVLFRDMKIQTLTKKTQELASDKIQMETSFISRLHDMEANRREIQRQRSTIVYRVKVKEKKKLISRQQIVEIGKRLRFKFIRERIQYKKIGATIDVSKFKDSFRPTYKQVQQLLSHAPFLLQYDQQLLFTKYLLQNDAPIDSDQDQKTNTTPIVKSILQKAIDPYETISSTQEHHLQQSLISLFDNNKTLIESIKKNIGKKLSEYIELPELRKYFRDYFVEVRDSLYGYMELKSYELCNKVHAINMIKLKDYVDGPLKKHRESSVVEY